MNTRSNRNRKQNIAKDECETKLKFDRRDLIKGAVALAGVTTASALLPVASEARPSRTQAPAPGAVNTLIVASNENAIVETTAG